MVNDYYTYLKLYEEGWWLLKNHPAPDFDFQTYLSQVTDQDFLDGLAGDHPRDQNYDFLHKTGNYTQYKNQLSLVCREKYLEFQQPPWLVNIQTPELLRDAGDLDDTYTFRAFMFPEQ